MNTEELSAIRTKLRNVNVEYSALVRSKAGEDRFVRMHELRAERQALMARVAGLGGMGGASLMAPRQQPLKAAVRSAT
jgi:hypothetical protein